MSVACWDKRSHQSRSPSKRAGASTRRGRRYHSSHSSYVPYFLWNSDDISHSAKSTRIPFLHSESSQLRAPQSSQQRAHFYLILSVSNVYLLLLNLHYLQVQYLVASLRPPRSLLMQGWRGWSWDYPTESNKSCSEDESGKAIKQAPCVAERHQ